MTVDLHQLAAEYVSDAPGGIGTIPAVKYTFAEASDVVVRITERRIQSVATAHDAPLGLMLSGGVDSILVAATAVRLGYAPVCITVVNDDTTHEDEVRSVAVAKHLNLPHHVVRLTPSDIDSLTLACVRLLDSTELWEVTSAMPVLAAFREAAAFDLGPILTGAGADALFMGGETLAAAPDSGQGRLEFVNRVRAKVAKNFTRNRLIPDYYERLLGKSAWNFIQVFQTRPFVEFALSIDPSLLWRVGRDGQVFDKAVLRSAATNLGVPSDLVWTTKSPLQVSSGMISGVTAAARRHLSEDPAANVYANPRTEPIEHTVARLYLRTIQAESLA